MQKAQTAMEFLSTYSFTFLIIAIVLFVLLLFASLPKSTLPLQCSIYSGFNCLDNAYFNSTQGSQLILLMADTQPGVINISQFTATLNYVQSTNGICTPNIATAGQKIYCTANFTQSATIGTLYTGTFLITAKYCANAPGSYDALNCSKGSSSVTYGGSLQTQATAYSLSNLPPPTDIYCVGGSGGGTRVTYANISTKGIGQWIGTNSYPIVMQNAGCAISNNYIYCVGSNSAPETQVYYAPVTSNGVGVWKQTKNYPVQMQNAGCSAYRGSIYCVGSNTGSGNQAYYGALTSNGIPNWIPTNSYPIALNNAGCSVYRGYIYCVGSNTGGESQVYYAPLVANAGIGNWIATTSYPIQFSNAGCSIYNSYIYCMGGQGGTQTSVYYAPVTSNGIGNWIATASYPIQLSSAGCVVYQGYIFCVGSNSGPGNQAYYAPILNPGIGTWIAANSYPAALQGAYCTTPSDTGGYYSGGGASS